MDKLLPDSRAPASMRAAVALVALLRGALRPDAHRRSGCALQIVGANPRAASHAGVNVPLLIIAGFCAQRRADRAAAAPTSSASGATCAADWNPAYGDTVIPFVFLARLNAHGLIPFIAFFSVLSTGGELAARKVDLPTDFLLVLVGAGPAFMTVIEFLGPPPRARRQLPHARPQARGAAGHRCRPRPRRDSARRAPTSGPRSSGRAWSPAGCSPACR